MQAPVHDSPSLVQRIRALSHPLRPQPTGVSPRLSRLEGLRAVLFDVYGTLLISASGDIAAGQGKSSAGAFRAALAQAGLRVGTDDAVDGAELMVQAIHKAHVTRREEGIEYPEVDMLEIWRQVLDALPPEVLAGAGVSEEQIQRLAVEYECRVNPVWPMPGLKETLAALREQGVILGIVSNAQFYTPLLFEALLQATPEALGFAPTFCAWSYQVLEAKPSPQLFQRVLWALEAEQGIPAAHTLYVGNDRLKDIWPATQLGCKTALFAGDQRSLRLREQDNRCGSVTPSLVLTELRQLTEIVTI
jgi:putative hydrolase of the HAD superfamily